MGLNTTACNNQYKKRLLTNMKLNQKEVLEVCRNNGSKGSCFCLQKQWSLWENRLAWPNNNWSPWDFSEVLPKKIRDSRDWECWESVWGRLCLVFWGKHATGHEAVLVCLCRNSADSGSILERLAQQRHFLVIFCFQPRGGERQVCIHFQHDPAELPKI